VLQHWRDGPLGDHFSGEGLVTGRNGNDYVDGGPGFDGLGGDSLAAAGVEGRALATTP
jgi:hypothetical protein